MLKSSSMQQLEGIASLDSKSHLLANEFHQTLHPLNRLFKRIQPSFIYIFLPQLLSSNSISLRLFSFPSKLSALFMMSIPIMLRSMKMHSRKTENIKQMLAVVFLDTSVLAFFLSSTMAVMLMVMNGSLKLRSAADRNFHVL